MPADGSLLRLTAFQRDLRNYLADLADPSWAAGIVRGAISSGALTGAQLEWEKWLGANLSAGVWVRYTDSENDDTGLEIPYEPEITGAFSLNYLDSRGWRIGADWSYIGSRYADLANATKLGSFNTLNLRAARQLSLQTDVFITVENLLDEEDGIWQGYPSRGRNVKAGVEYRF
jgi:outer membrane receptor protein involved in Fe transport